MDVKVKEKRRRRWFKPFFKSQEGAAAVEFALVAGPFIFVLGCICEAGLMMFTEFVLQDSVQEAARRVRTGQVTAADGTLLMNAGTFKSLICEQVSLMGDCAGGVTVYVNSAATFAALKTATPNPLSIGKKLDGTTSGSVFTPGGSLKATAVIATYDWDFKFPFMSFFGNINDNSTRRLYGLAIMRNEPY